MELLFLELSNQTKGVVYIQTCKLNEEFEKKNLKEDYPFIKNPVEASFIKSRSPIATAVLLTYNL